MRILAVMFISCSIASARASQEPPVPNMSLYRGLLHAHTSYSNGQGTPDEAYKMAREAGLQFFAITEHYNPAIPESAGTHLTAARYLALQDSAESHTQPGHFIALFGQELSAIPGGNHINVFDTSDLVAPPDNSFTSLYSQWLPAHPDIKLIQMNHPRSDSLIPKDPSSASFDNQYGIRELDADYPRLLALSKDAFHLLEIIDGLAKPGISSDPHPGTNEATYFFYLNQGFHLGVSVGQDNHKKDWGVATRGRTGVWSETLDKQSLYEALAARRTFASEDDTLSIWFDANSTPMGGIAELPSDSQLTLSVSVSDEDEPEAQYLVELFYDDSFGGSEAKLVFSQTLTGDGRAHFVHSATPGSYYFARISQLHEGITDLAWTSPVWIAQDQDGDGG